MATGNHDKALAVIYIIIYIYESYDIPFYFNMLFMKLLGYSSSDLYSERFYHNLEISHFDLHKYSKHCNKINVNNGKSHMKNLCKKVLKYLEHSSIPKKNSTGYDECKLLNYWIYDNLASFYGNDNTKDINIAFSALQFIWSYLVINSSEKSYYNKCKPLFKELLNFNDWKKRKELYDYCINYELISPTCSFYGNTCSEYCEYIEKTKESGIYDHFENICSSGKGNCPQFYNKCKEYNPKIVLDKLNCHEILKAKEKITGGPGDLNHLPGQKVEAAASALGTEETNKTSGIGIKVTNSVLGAAPVLLTATALYRYTPLGPWILRFGGGRTNSMGAIDMVPTYMQETSDIFSDNDANYISYQPM